MKVGGVTARLLRSQLFICKTDDWGSMGDLPRGTAPLGLRLIVAFGFTPPALTHTGLNMDTPPLPPDASNWLRATYLGSKLVETDRAVREAKFLYEALKHRAQIESGVKSVHTQFPKTSMPPGIVWNELGHTVTLPSTTHRSEIIKEGAKQGWRVSIVSHRKTGELKAMAVERLPQINVSH